MSYPVVSLPGTGRVIAAQGDATLQTPSQTFVTRRFNEGIGAAPIIGQSLPRLTGVQRMGETFTLDDSMLTNVASRTWFRNGVEDAGITGSTITAGMMESIQCTVVADEGTFTTPTLSTLHMHDDANHNVMDNAVVALVGHGPVTHIAVANGPFNTASTWDVGQVPGAGAKVLVPEGVTVDYDVSVSPRLDTIRVDGTVQWALDQSTDLLVETLVVTPSGAIVMGDSLSNQVPSQYTHNITISNRSYRLDPNSPTDLDIANDPTLISRGILVLGEWTAFGHHRETWVKTALLNLPVAGDTSVTLDHAPENWVVGDTIVIPGTNVDIFDKVNTRYDEERVITDVTGSVVSWDSGEPLIYDHFATMAVANRPPDAVLPIVNKGRNIKIRSEPGAAIHQRGHTMCMHGASKTDIWDVSFFEMGRTDKSKPAGIIDENGMFKFLPVDVDKYATDPFNYETVTASSNIQSRYPTHLHFVGFKKAFHDLVRNCYIEDAKAWAAVWHGCEADWIGNVVYRFQGSGFVGETGNEQGATRNNVAFGLETTFGSRGLPKSAEEDEGVLGDVFRRGYGFAWRGRAIISTGNWAIGCAHGHVFYHRSIQNSFADLIELNRSEMDVHDLNWLTADTIKNADYPITHFDDNYAIGCSSGLAVVKSQSRQSHDLNIIIQNFKAWGCHTGIAFDYIGTYLTKNVDLCNTEFVEQKGTYGAGRRAGITMTKTNQLALIDVTTRNYRHGLQLDATQPSSSFNPIGYDDDDVPKIIIARHTSLGDEQTDANLSFSKPEDDPYLYTKFLASNFTEVNRPTVTAPFILGEMISMDESDGFINVQSGNKVDSVSSLGLLPKGPGPEGANGWDNAGFLYGHPNPSPFRPVGMRRRILDIVRDYGYHTYNGDKIVLAPLYFSDRATGMSIKHTHAVKLPNNLGTGYSNATNLGEFTRYTTPLSATNDTITRTMTVGGTDSFNVLTAAGMTAEAGATVTLGDPFMTTLFGPEPAHFKPNYGDLSVSENGDVSFEATPGYVGADRWLAYAYDGRGSWVTIETIYDIQAA